MTTASALPLVHFQTTGVRFWTRHGLVPLLAFAMLLWLIERFALDLRLADLLYRLEGGSWALRHHWLTDQLIHSGGRQFSLALLGAVLLGLALSWPQPGLAKLRPGLLYLALATVGSAGLVGLGKHLSHQACPWNLARYGADLPYHSLFSATPSDSAGMCFPAGHASAGYAWLALYFVCRHYRPRLAPLALLPGLSLGLLFGLSQQLRGAHFLSHDLWTLAISWFWALLLYRWLLMPHNFRVGDRVRRPDTQAEGNAYRHESAGRR